MKRGDHSGGTIIGTVLVLSGIVFLVNNLRFGLTMKELWPVFLLSFGVGMYIQFARERADYGLLMPATILAVSGGVLLYCALYGWERLAGLWPVLVLGISGGFLLMFLLGKREVGLLVPAGILAAVGLVFLRQTGRWARFWPLALILVGIALILPGRRNK